jgi:hypothetical protein
MVWSRAEDDELMFGLGKEFVDRLKKAADAKGLFLPMVWMNNAQAGDDVLASYGDANLAKMKQVSKKYDPAQTFQLLCAGPFKLSK